jgi:CHAT domain-containing protein
MAVPCTIDLRDPSQSNLLLSDNAENPAQSVLSPANISALKIQASLVVLSACDFAGSNTSQFARNTRFPGEFLRSGAGAVIASQWSPGDAETAEFMGRFYRQLQVQPDVGAALWETKKSYLGGDTTTTGDAWAAFQLYID